MAWHRTSRHARGYGAAWEKTRKRVLERDLGLCQACMRKGQVRVGNECHHIRPKAQGGTDADENLETLCHDCHEEADAIAAGRTTKKRYRVALDGTIIDV